MRRNDAGEHLDHEQSGGQQRKGSIVYFHRRMAGRVFADDGVLAIVDRQHAAAGGADEERISVSDLAGDPGCGYGTLPAGFEFAGVWSTTGLGRGHYPVYVDMIDTPETGPRVARIVIDCLGTEADPASAELRGDLFDMPADLQNRTW